MSNPFRPYRCLSELVPSGDPRGFHEPKTKYPILNAQVTCTIVSDVEDFQASMSDSITSAPQTLKASPVAFRVSLIGLIPDS